MHRRSQVVEYREIYKLLRIVSVVLVAREEIFFVSLKSSDNLSGRLLVS